MSKSNLTTQEDGLDMGLLSEEYGRVSNKKPATPLGVGKRI